MAFHSGTNFCINCYAHCSTTRKLVLVISGFFFSSELHAISLVPRPAVRGALGQFWRCVWLFFFEFLLGKCTSQWTDELALVPAAGWVLFGARDAVRSSSSGSPFVECYAFAVIVLIRNWKMSTLENNHFRTTLYFGGRMFLNMILSNAIS